jgi:hypothetical protein
MVPGPGQYIDLPIYVARHFSVKQAVCQATMLHNIGTHEACSIYGDDKKIAGFVETPI